MNCHNQMRIIGLVVGASLMLVACQPVSQEAPSPEAQTKALIAQCKSSVENLEAQLQNLEEARYQASYQLDEINSSLQIMHTEMRELRRKLDMPQVEQLPVESAAGFPLATNVILIVVVMLAFAIFWKIKTNRQSEAEFEMAATPPAEKSTKVEPPPKSSTKK